MRQMRWTAFLLRPSSRASFRHDQWVEPSVGGRWVAASTPAWSSGVMTVAIFHQPVDALLQEALLPPGDGGAGVCQSRLMAA